MKNHSLPLLPSLQFRGKAKTNFQFLCDLWRGESDCLCRGVRLISTGGHIGLVVAFKGPNVILGLYKCNYSLTRGKELGAAAG